MRSARHFVDRGGNSSRFRVFIFLQSAAAISQSLEIRSSTVDFRGGMIFVGSGQHGGEEDESKRMWCDEKGRDCRLKDIEVVMKLVLTRQRLGREHAKHAGPRDQPDLDREHEVSKQKIATATLPYTSCLPKVQTNIHLILSCTVV